MKSLGIGLVGLGKWGKNYLKTICSLNNAKLFVADIRNAIPAGYYEKIHFVSFDVILDNPDVQAVIIATPDHTHYELAIKALRKGKDVLVEKPMALHPEHAEEMTGLSQKQNLILSVGHTSLYSVEFEILRHQIQQGVAGKIMRLEAFRSSNGKPGGDILWDLAPHDVAMAISLAGEPFSAAVKEITCDHAIYEMQFPDGVLFTGEVQWQSPPFQRWFKVVGTKKTIVAVEPVGGIISHASPLTRLCQDFLSSCRTRCRPVSDALLGLKVIRCLWMMKKPAIEVC